MTGSVLIVDIRRHRGNSNLVIELVGRNYPAANGVVPKWLVRPDQAHLLPPDRILGQADQVDGSWAGRIVDLVVQSAAKAQNGETGTPSWVLSYDMCIVSEIRKLTASGFAVTAVHIGQLHTEQRFARFGQSRPLRVVNGPGQFSLESRNVAPFGASEPSMSLEEAIKLAKEILREGGYTSPERALLQKDLRPQMIRRDRRAARHIGDPNSDTLLSDIVNAGLQEGWLKRFRKIPGKTGVELIYLTEPQTTVVSIDRIPRAETRQEAQPVPTPSLPIEVIAQAHQSESSTVSRPPKHPTRATLFEATLSKARIGAIPETRDLLLDAVEQALSAARDKALTLEQVFAQALSLAKTLAAEQAYDAERNWPVAERCIRRLMLSAEVILDCEEKPLQDRIGSSSKCVGKLASEFRKVCSAYLAEYIIRHVEGFNYDDDTYYLSLTLFRRGKQRAVAAEDLKAKADEILAYLESAGRIHMGEDRVIKISPTKSLSAVAQGKV